ncbi:MAG: methyltransferase domain-containing protein [Acidobacteria bacterium]|nr:MAG: methyltransferase domain-containing protein [Acidobacteriota bacterium]
MKPDYVHGYSAREQERLADQAATLTSLLHCDTRYSPGAIVLEAGCGIGAQTVILAGNSPEASFVSVDISDEALAVAERRVQDAGLRNVTFRREDVFDLSFPAESFDHVFVCFVLEHLVGPERALAELGRVLKTGGSLTAIEGDHGSAFFHPESDAARTAIQCLVDLQRQAGGDPNIGRRLFPLMTQNGFRDVIVSPRMVYADASRPQMVDGFTRKTFTAMVEGVGKQAIERQKIDPLAWAKGIQDLYRTAESEGTFCYTFFKAIGRK